MKIAVNITRILVGLLFIFSGLVKANDPMGLSYKMQEFFEVWGVHGMNGLTLPLSVFMNAFEIIAGTALLLGWRIRIFMWLLLLLILFFTFLTGYTYFTGEPKNCGCFGDCLPISSRTSFLKDVLLTGLIGFLFLKQALIKPLLPARLMMVKMISVILFSFGFQWYTLTYLPVIDCLPFKTGNNIPQQMMMPVNAIPDSTVITFVYKKDGKEIEFTADKFPADFNGDNYQFVSRYDQVVRKGRNNVPPIKGFVLSGDSNEDSTAFVLQRPAAILLFIERFSKAGKGWIPGFEKAFTAAKTKHIPVFLITAEPGIARDRITGTSFADIPVFKCDYKVIETASRTPVTLYLLTNGTVKGKWSSRRFGRAVNIISGMASR